MLASVLTPIVIIEPMPVIETVVVSRRANVDAAAEEEAALSAGDTKCPSAIGVAAATVAADNISARRVSITSMNPLCCLKFSCGNFIYGREKRKDFSITLFAEQRFLHSRRQSLHSGCSLRPRVARKRAIPLIETFESARPHTRAHDHCRKLFIRAFPALSATSLRLPIAVGERCGC
jgi:type IV secretory pathway VirB3-like protein